MAYVDEARALVHPGTEVFFPGKMDPSRLGFAERMLCKMMKARNEDLRDWKAINGWAHSLLAERI